MKTTVAQKGTSLTLLAEEEIDQLSSAILCGVKKIKPSVERDFTIVWAYLENKSVKIIPNTQEGDFIKVEIGKNIITPINKKFLVVINKWS